MSTREGDAPLPTQFDPASIERTTYERWLAAGAFGATASASSRAGGERTPYTIVIPPPNVTDVLHMGHGLNNTVQDVVIRWRRMCGDVALWVPGTDHAGIATQNVVEKALAREGLTRFDLGREAFVARTTAWVDKTGGTILEQLEAIGASCDWSRTAYTLSPELSTAVREAFVQLHERGLVYRGHRVIHWCPRCLTSLSDEEAEHHETSGALYHVFYPLAGADDARAGITIATTRPETILADVAIAVHPADERYRALVGRSVLLPITGREIPVIADEYSDPAFGTGAVKITPAHDANDFEVGVRHGLAMPVVISPAGIMEEVADAEGRVPLEVRSLDRFVARERIVAMLRESGRLLKVEPHAHSVRRCYRCDTVVEPRLSDQWFVRMAPLAEPALAAVRNGEIRILPDRWEAVYVNWMENIRDWNISRQLWWGHRIPVWYCDACGADPIVRRQAPDGCPRCGGAVRQDEDVLDTWFSSWLWPFSTLGWPDENAADLRAFYPTDLLVTAPEILFFWVARMAMAGFAFMGRAPFHSIYLHGTVRDPSHRKMSKSLGNGIDPLDVVRLYGADALRYTVIAGMGMGADLVLDREDLEKSFTPGRNFTTKLWNIARFLLSNVEGSRVVPLAELPSARLTRADRWILDRLNAAIGECDAALGSAKPSGGVWPEADRYAGLRLNEYAEAARRFVWNELADWYVESAKPRLAPDAADGDIARSVLVHVFDQALRLLHPVVPFITETLWQRLPGRRVDDMLAVARWPERADYGGDGAQFELVREAVVALRQARAEYGVAPGAWVDAVLVPESERARETLADDAALIGRLARARVRLEAAGPAGNGAARATHALLSDGSHVAMPLAGAIDVEKECARLGAELAELSEQLTALGTRLASERFVSRAPAHVVEGERTKFRDWTARRDQLARKVASLCGTG
ncbi:MAG: valine--tRNA ligase [Gemmatimonadaceae bacterium]